MLENLLTGNILSLAKGVGWQVEKQIKVQICEIIGEKIIHYKCIPLLTFDLDFNSNVALPDFLGIGKSASHGFGVISKKYIHNNN